MIYNFLHQTAFPFPNKLNRTVGNILQMMIKDQIFRLQVQKLFYQLKKNELRKKREKEKNTNDKKQILIIFYMKMFIVQ